MSRAYGTRYHGTKVPPTVALEAENNLLMSDEEDEDEEGFRGRRRVRRNQFMGRARRRRDYGDSEEDEDEEEYDEREDDEDEYNESDDELEYGRRRRARSSGGRASNSARHQRQQSKRRPAGSSSQADPFRALQELSWRSSTLQPQPTTGAHGIPQVSETSFLPAPQPITHPLMDSTPPAADDAWASALAGGMDGFSAGPGPENDGLKLMSEDFDPADDPNNRRNTWSVEEDKVLAGLVTRYGAKKWGVIAAHLPARNAKQCHQRWHYVLKPSISRDTWSEREDYIIYYYQRLLGNKWSQIAKYLHGRTGYAVRNRHSFLMKNYQRGIRPQAPPEHFAYSLPETVALQQQLHQQQQQINGDHDDYEDEDDDDQDSESDDDAEAESAVPNSAMTVAQLPATSIMSTPQEALAHVVTTSSTPAATYTLSSPVWDTSVMTSRASMAAAVPQLDPVIWPAIGSSLTSLSDPNAERYSAFYRQPMRYYASPQQLQRARPAPPPAYMFTPPGQPQPEEQQQQQPPSPARSVERNLSGDRGLVGVRAGLGGHESEEEEEDIHLAGGGVAGDMEVARREESQEQQEQGQVRRTLEVSQPTTRATTGTAAGGSRSVAAYGSHVMRTPATHPQGAGAEKKSDDREEDDDRDPTLLYNMRFGGQQQRPSPQTPAAQRPRRDGRPPCAPRTPATRAAGSGTTPSRTTEKRGRKTRTEEEGIKDAGVGDDGGRASKRQRQVVIKKEVAQ